jgi:hypothetical protein
MKSVELKHIMIMNPSSLTYFTVDGAVVSTDMQEWYLVCGVRSISHRYVSEGHTLALSLDEHTVLNCGRSKQDLTSLGSGSIDVIRHISEEMNDSQSTSVVITNRYADCGGMDQNSHHKYDSYLLLTLSRVNEESHIVQSVESQLKEHSSYAGWNPRARFVVTVKKILCCNAEELSQRIIEELWKRKILNVIVVIPLTYATLSDAVTDSRNRAESLVIEFPSLVIQYKWFKTVHLDMWRMEGGGIFVRNLFVLPMKSSGSSQGCELRGANVLTALRFERTTQNHGKNRNIKLNVRLQIRLINRITRSMNVTLLLLKQVEKFRIREEKFGKYVEVCWVHWSPIRE